MPNGPFTISVMFPADEAGLNYILRIDETGRTEFTAESNELKPNVPAIGVYRTDIKAKQALKLKDTLLKLDKRGIPPSEPLPPGSDVVVISLEQEDSIIRRTLDPSALTPAMCKVAEDISAIREQAYKRPIRVITMDVSLPNTKVQQNQKLSLDIRLTAQGMDVVKVINPIGKNNQSGGITIRAVRSDLPIEEIWPQHSKHLSLEDDHLVNAKIPPQDDPNLLTLRPSQIAYFSFNIRVDWEPGQYDLRAIFESLSSQSDVLKGKITSGSVTLTVMQ